MNDKRKNEVFGLFKGWVEASDAMFETFQTCLEFFADTHSITAEEFEWLMDNAYYAVVRGDEEEEQ